MIIERLRRLARSILPRYSPEEIVAAGPDWRLVCAWPSGDAYVLQALWDRLGIGQILNAQAGARPLGFDVERALFAIVANRACAPASKLYCYEQWLKEDAAFPVSRGWRCSTCTGRWTCLAANKEAIERASR